MTHALPQLAGTAFVTDGGLETDLIFHHGVDLSEFAAFPLVEDDRGRELLTAYYDEYAGIARRAGAALLLEAPTERADPDEAADYHSAQLRSFAAAGADIVTALTLTGAEEAIGVVRAARAAGLPVAIGFTVETDGRLPDGTPLGTAVERVDAEAAPDYFVLNCAHPIHVAPGLDGGAWAERIVGFRPNASTRTHAELDEAEELDAGDPAELASSYVALRRALPNLSVVGGCCGTDASHVAALWGV